MSKMGLYWSDEHLTHLLDTLATLSKKAADASCVIEANESPIRVILEKYNHDLPRIDQITLATMTTVIAVLTELGVLKTAEKTTIFRYRRFFDRGVVVDFDVVRTLLRKKARRAS